MFKGLLKGLTKQARRCFGGASEEAVICTPRDDYREIFDIYDGGIDFDNPGENGLAAAQKIMDFVDQALVNGSFDSQTEKYQVHAAWLYNDAFSHVPESVKNEAVEDFVQFAEECRRVTYEDIVRLSFGQSAEELRESAHGRPSDREVLLALSGGVEKKGYMAVPLDGHSEPVLPGVEEFFWKQYGFSEWKPEDVTLEEAGIVAQPL